MMNDKVKNNKKPGGEKSFEEAMAHLDAEAELYAKMKKILRRSQYSDWKQMHQAHKGDKKPEAKPEAAAPAKGKKGKKGKKGRKKKH